MADVNGIDWISGEGKHDIQTIYQCTKYGADRFGGHSGGSFSEGLFGEAAEKIFVFSMGHRGNPSALSFWSFFVIKCVQPGRGGAYGQGSSKTPSKEKKEAAERKTGASDFAFQTGEKNYVSTGNVLHPFVKYGAMVWLGVLSMLFTWNLFLWLQMRKRTAAAIRLEGRIYECGEIPSPFVMGIICPRIYLPFRLEKEEQEYIIRHESYHIQRKDHDE